MNVYGTVNVGDRSTYHNSSSEAHVTVTDTLTIGSGGIFQNNSDGIYGSINLNSEMNIANIRNSGIFRMLGGQSVLETSGTSTKKRGLFSEPPARTSELPIEKLPVLWPMTMESAVSRLPPFKRTVPEKW